MKYVMYHKYKRLRIIIEIILPRLNSLRIVATKGARVFLAGAGAVAGSFYNGAEAPLLYARSAPITAVQVCKNTDCEN